MIFLKLEKKSKLYNIRILRLEQIYPFPKSSLKEFLSKTPQAEIVWCQEEPENMGCFRKKFLKRAFRKRINLFKS
jgi:2-oxoglutarate dehydrogenase complex dehydrogenase (E1) component-like enzyme